MLSCFVQHDGLVGKVEIGRRLVQQQNGPLRLWEGRHAKLQHRPCDMRALALASRQLREQSVAQSFESYGGDAFASGLLDPGDGAAKPGTVAPSSTT